MLIFFFTFIFFQHYKLLSDRLQDLGSHFGALPVHGGKYMYYYFFLMLFSFFPSKYIPSTIHCHLCLCSRVGLVQTDSGERLPT